MNVSDLFLETVITLNGNRKVRRIKTTFLLLCGFSFIPIGIHLVVVHKMLFGGTLVTLLAPCFLLYPVIRFFFFGGRDSVAAVVTTVVVEEVTKSALKGIIKDISKDKNK